jgi:hypothetical protein
MVLMKQMEENQALTRENLKRIPRSKDGGKGVYILFDRSMPVYVGKGNIRTRIKRHGKNERMSGFWDHFSWYIPHNPKLVGELEAVLHCMLPHFPRLLNRQRARLKDKKGKRLAQTKTNSN